MVTLKFLLVAVFLMAKNVNAEAFDDDKNFKFSDCTGSLVVVTTNRTTKRFSESKKKTALIASSLHVEGCGCFYLYRRPNFKGSSMSVTHARDSQSISGDSIGFKIRSIEKVSCENM